MFFIFVCFEKLRLLKLCDLSSTCVFGQLRLPAVVLRLRFWAKFKLFSSHFNECCHFKKKKGKTPTDKCLGESDEMTSTNTDAGDVRTGFTKS